MTSSDYSIDDLFFDDIDHFNQAIKEWDLQFVQLERGRLQASDLQFLSPDFLLGYCTSDKALEQTGTSPFGLWSFAFITGDTIIWKGMELSTDEVVVLKPGSEIKGIGRPDFRVFTLSVPETVLERVCEENELDEAMNIIQGNDSIRVDRIEQLKFISGLIGIVNEIRSNPAVMDSPGYKGLCDREIPLKICQLIEGPGHKKSILSSPIREKIIKTCTQFLSDLPGDPVTVTDLCRINQVSERTLQYTFKEYYGISPKAYLKARMLNSVHAILRKGTPDNTMVTNIAYQFGFWHMGQFAHDYKRMFGRLPSETLKDTT